MTKPTQTNRHQQQTANTDFFIWLGNNMVPIALLLLLLVVGIVFLLVKTTSTTNEAPKTTVKAKWTDKDWQQALYFGTDCDKDENCRQLKRIFAEGGASQEAIRQNLLAADKNLTFQQLQDNPTKYEGTAWAFEGKILEIIAQEKRGIGDYILVVMMIGEDPAKRVSVKGHFSTNFVKDDIVYVVGYINGMSNPRNGPNRIVPAMSARAFLRPSEASDLLARTGTN